MPRLVKGGKWVYGWVLVGPEGEIVIPPPAWREFEFQARGEAIFTPGSRRSGGFGVSTPGLMHAVSNKLGGGAIHQFARRRFGDGRVTLPPETGVRPGQRLLAVRGSRYALGFVVQGPIYKEALEHPELECFGGYGGDRWNS